MPVTFQVVGPLADFGNDARAGIKVRATADPPVKHSDTATHSNEPETVTTDAAGAFTLELISVVGVWYTIRTPYSNAMNTVRLAGYIPDVDDPTTGVVFPPGTVISLRDVMDEDPTPGYEGLVYSGPPNVLTIGTVTTGAPGSDADADIGGVSPSQTLDLVIPRGDVGPKGDTGDTGDVGPKGDTGDDSTVPGPPNVLAVGTVTTGAAGTNAAATITGAGPVQTLNLTIPKGDPGGWVPSTLSGTVDLNTLTTAGLYFCDGPSTNLPAPGSGTYVEVQRASGTSIGQRATVGQTGRVFVRNLYAGSWLPWVELAPKGSIGGSDLTGTGSPEGVVTAPVGTYYTDTAGTNGAWRWLKKTGSGNTGWKVSNGDTGLRVLDQTFFQAPFNVTGPASQAYVRRINDVVYLSVLLYTTAPLTAGTYAFPTIPYLWGLGVNTYAVAGSGPLWSSNSGAYLGAIVSGSVVIPATVPAGTPMRGTIAQVWAAPWPTTLPGTAA